MAGKARKLHPKTVSDLDDLDALKKKYLEHLRVAGLIGWSATKIGRHIQTIETWRKADAKFDQDVMDAVETSTQALRENIYLRAMNPSDRNSAILAIFEMKRRDPSYRDHLNLNAKHLVAGTMSTPAKTDPDTREILKTMTKELLKELAQKPNDP